MAQFVVDSFAGTAGTSLENRAGATGATWTKAVGYTGGGAVIDTANRLRSNTSGPYDYYASGVPATADYDVMADLAFLSVLADYPGVIARVSTVADTMYQGAWDSGGAKWYIQRHLNGAAANVVTGVVTTPATGSTYRLKLSVRGATLTLFVSSDPVGTAEASRTYVQQVTYTDAAPITAAGRAGVTGYGSDTDTTGVHLANFLAVDAAAPASMAASPASVPYGANTTITLTGTNTAWTTTTTAILAGGTGASIVSQSISGQVITLTSNPGTAVGTLSFTNSTDTAPPATVSVVAPVSLTLPTPTYTSGTTTTVTVTGTAAAGGTTPYTYQWQRNTKAATADAGWANVTGATSLAITDTPPTTPIYYRLRVMDATAAVVTSQAIPAPLTQTTLSLLFIGNSITAGTGATSASTNFVATMQNQLMQIAGMRAVGVLNKGVSGTYTTDWQSGNANGYLSGAAAAANTAYGSGNWDACIMLGTNDARTYGGHVQVVAGPASTAGTYAANMTAITSYLLANGARRVILNQDPAYVINSSIGGNVDSGIDQLRAYDQANAALANGTTILTGDRTALDQFEAALSTLIGDGVHPTQAGHNFLGTIQATAYARVTGLLGTAGYAPQSGAVRRGR